jgi:hypothetical protein
MVQLNPLENTSPAPLSVPTAFRAWCFWANSLGVGCLLVPSIQRSFEGRLSDDAKKQLVVALCEVYSRAIFETTLGLEYDLVDSHADVHVFHEIESRWGLPLAELVHARVLANGPVSRDLPTLLNSVRPWDQTDPQ